MINWTIVLESDNSIISKLIMRFSNAARRVFGKSTIQPYSHSFLINETYGYESTAPVIRIMSPADIEKKIKNENTHLEFYKPIRTPADQMLIATLNVVNRTHNRLYPFWQMVGFIVVLVKYFATRKIINNPYPKGEWCSEIVYDYISQLDGYKELLNGYKKNMFSPTDLKEVLDSNPLYFKQIAIKPYGEKVASIL